MTTEGRKGETLSAIIRIIVRIYFRCVSIKNTNIPSWEATSSRAFKKFTNSMESRVSFWCLENRFSVPNSEQITPDGYLPPCFCKKFFNIAHNLFPWSLFPSGSSDKILRISLPSYIRQPVLPS